MQKVYFLEELIKPNKIRYNLNSLKIENSIYRELIL